MKRTWIILVILIAVAAAVPLLVGTLRPTPRIPPGPPIPEVAPHADLPEPASGRTHIEMHNVNYRYDNALAVRIRYLRGKLVPARPGVIPTFDDSASFSVSVDSAEIAISSNALAALMNKHVFSAPDAPIKNLKISMEGSEMKQVGSVHKGIDVPFEMEAEVSPTPEGTIRLHPRTFKVIHIPVKGALHKFGLHLADLVNPKGAPGVGIVKDDLILDPSQMLPSPRMQGHITAVRIEGDDMVEVIGPPLHPAASTRNYIKFTGGIIRFGKLTMHDADLSLIDAEPKDPFEFSLTRYKDQLVAGYSKTTPSFGLDVFMPDVNKIGASR